MDRTKRLDQISKEMDKIMEMKSEIIKHQRTLELKCDEYKKLDKQDKDLSQKWENLYEEQERLMKEEVAEAYAIIDEIKAKQKELEDSGFFEKLNKTNDVLDNPDAYTEEEIKEADKFEKRLNEVFKTYAEENPDGLIQIVYEDK